MDPGGPRSAPSTGRLLGDPYPSAQRVPGHRWRRPSWDIIRPEFSEPPPSYEEAMRLTSAVDDDLSSAAIPEQNIGTLLRWSDEKDCDLM